MTTKGFDFVIDTAVCFCCRGRGDEGAGEEGDECAAGEVLVYQRIEGEDGLRGLERRRERTGGGSSVL